MSTFFGKSFTKASQDADKSKTKTTKGTIKASGQGYYYLTGLVREFISEPDAYLINRGKKLVNTANKDYDIMTKNSIIAHIIDRSGTRQGKRPVLCFPFFPHLCLPVKPGEHVWILKEENDGRDLYYWISRKIGVKQTEDVNYTHAERLFHIDTKLQEYSSPKKGGDLFDQKNELDKRDFVSFDNISQENLHPSLTINGITKDSVAYNNEFTSEPVPPVKKKCGDTLLMGSNNSHVHLTTEKFLLNENNANDFTPIKFGSPPGRRTPFSPAIDLCVGRKYSEMDDLRSVNRDEASSGPVSIIRTKRGGSFEEYESYEINKIEEIFLNRKRHGEPLDNPQHDNVFENPGFDPKLSIDTDATNCGARIYLSNNSAIDATFKTNLDNLSLEGGPSVATYAQHNRMAADGSLRLTNVTGQQYLDMSSDGNVMIKTTKNMGQQFLSLKNTGITRLQGSSMIELAAFPQAEGPPQVLVTPAGLVINGGLAVNAAAAPPVPGATSLPLPEPVEMSTPLEGGIIVKKDPSLGESEADGVLGLAPLRQAAENAQLYTNLGVDSTRLPFDTVTNGVIAAILNLPGTGVQERISSGEGNSLVPQQFEESFVFDLLKLMATKYFYAE